jgi:hypothetical protein
MVDLFLNRRKITNVFSLLGNKENDITYSIGWALASSPTFLKSFLQRVIGVNRGLDPNTGRIVLQEFRRRHGITDIEIRDRKLHVIVEAKRGWAFPKNAQLSLYLRRLKQFKAPAQFIVTMSEASEEFARQFQGLRVGNVPVRHVSWQTVSRLSHCTPRTHSERRLLQELRNYIETIVNTQQQESNWVYVVSLGVDEWMPGLNFIDVVEKRNRYFHPYGRGGWPLEPPNYLAFRYRGELQSVHHVKKVEVIRNFRPYFREAPDKNGRPFFIYELGPVIRPNRKVKTGNIFRAARRWAMLDLLLTSKTILEASRKSRARLRTSDLR